MIQFSGDLFFTREQGTFNCSFALIHELTDDSMLADLYMHTSERSYYNLLTAVKRKESFLAGRIAAKLAVVRQTSGQAFNSIKIEAGVFQQPVLSVPGYNNLQVSITHTDESAAAIIFPEAHPIGIDIEIVKTDITALAENVLTTAEKNLLDAHQLYNATGITMLWSAKEALSKILRTGFTLDLPILEIAAMEQGPQHLVFFYKNFMQYKCAVMVTEKNHVFSIAFPARSEADLAALYTCLK